jgi:hypothetical protein
VISLKREIDSCMHKIELGWGTRGESFKLYLINNGRLDLENKALTQLGTKEVGLVHVQPKIDLGPSG